MSRAQPASNGARPQDVNNLQRPNPAVASGVDAQAAKEDATRIHTVGAYAKPSRIESRVPSGSQSGAPYEDVGAVYATPSLKREKMAFKEYLIDSESSKQNVSWARTDADVDRLYEMWTNRQVYDKDQFVANLVDLREPGKAQWMANIYPDFMKRRLQEIDRQAMIVADLKKLDMFGIHSEKDLDLLVGLKSGRIELTQFDSGLKGYKPGWFARRGRNRTPAEPGKDIWKNISSTANGTAVDGWDNGFGRFSSAWRDNASGSGAGPGRRE